MEEQSYERQLTADINESYLNKISRGDCRSRLPHLAKHNIDLFLSNIPYSVNLDDLEELHDNTNSSLLGHSPEQAEKFGFKRRGKPINVWSQDASSIWLEYLQWYQECTNLI